MDSFSEEQSELTGSLISMEFNQSGRIMQLWASDPALPEEGEEFQFVLSPIAFGEESAEDYYPGTILIGARTDPNSPWILSRNATAELIYPFSDMDDIPEYDPGSTSFEYEFPLLPEISAIGRFYEIPGILPQIAWDLELKNTSSAPIEIGELAFPLALNNYYDGFGWSDEQLKILWNSRVYIHQFIGGAASWLFAQRMTSSSPGLLIFPGDGTEWEFFTHVPASLNTPFQWEGIPVIYIYSRAVTEREGWKGWANGHTSLILAPNESKKFQMRFVPTEQGRQDSLFKTLAVCGRPAIRLLPSAVAPANVGIAAEIVGSAPVVFGTSRPAQIETDFDDEGGFCFVSPQEPGPLTITFEDKEGRVSHIHLMFTEPIEKLIKKRAQWITKHQVVHNDRSPLKNAILMANVKENKYVDDPSEFEGASGIECSLADALFLAEKNTLYPEDDQIKILDRYIHNFLLDKIQNPGNMSVSSVFDEDLSLGAYPGRPLIYPYGFNLYHAMYRIASTYGNTAQTSIWYLHHAWATAMALFKYGWRNYVWTVGLPGYARIYQLLDDLKEEGLLEEQDALFKYVTQKAQDIVKQNYPYAGESVLDASGFEEVYYAGKFLSRDDHMERTILCVYAARSLAPSWWWYGSDKRSWDGADSTPTKAFKDRGEVCLAHTTIPNSLVFFESLDRDYLALPEAHMRAAFGGMMGPWALVREDGAASMCYCPDQYSKHYGYNNYTGASGLGYYHYLCCAGSYVLPIRNVEVYTFGCHFEQHSDHYLVRPWDGVGRRIIIRQISAEFDLSFGRIEWLMLDIRKRWFKIAVYNPTSKQISCKLKARGLWGSRLESNGQEFESVDGEFILSFVIQAGHTTKISGKVKE